MADTARYVMANRRAGKFKLDEKVGSRMAMTAALGLFDTAEIVADIAPEDPAARRIVVFDASPEEVAARRAAMPSDAMLEPEIPHWPVGRMPSHLPPVDLRAGHRKSGSATSGPA